MINIKNLFFDNLNIIILTLIIIIFVNLWIFKKEPGINSVFGYRIFTVLTGSMSPNINSGDLIIVKPVNSIKTGDVVTYVKNGFFITHRVIKKMHIDGREYYITKGDANNIEDESPVEINNILGKVILCIPKGGTVVTLLMSPPGLIMVCIPLIIVIFWEVKKVYKQ